MKKVVRLLTLAFVVSLLIGCASSSDVDNLQAQIDGLKATAVKAVSEAANAKNATINAASRAAVAEAVAKHAAQATVDICNKMDNMSGPGRPRETYKPSKQRRNNKTR
jgi:outer membrane lipoprotein-sorting protein